MRDGNKESAKEMLGAFMAIGGASLSIALVVTVGLAREYLLLNFYISIFSLFSLFLSFMSSIYLFLVTIPKLLNEEDAPGGIINFPDVRYTAAFSLGTFLVGIFSLLVSIFTI